MVLRRVHAAAAVVFVLAIIVQVVLAGLAIANLGGSGDFRTHIAFGYTYLGLAALALLLSALAARRPRNDVAVTVGLLVLYVVQTLLPGLKASMPFIAALPPLDAMLLFALAIWYARRALAGWRQPTASPMPTADVR